MKEKVAIAIEKDLLEAVDTLAQSENIKSRSQAIEVLLRRSIKLQPVTKAVMLLHPKEVGCLKKRIEGKTLMQKHLQFLKENGIKEIYIITKSTKDIPETRGIRVIEEKNPEGTASALKLVKKFLTEDFVVFNGDTFNDFDLKKMIAKHKQAKYLCTMGLISTDSTKFGSVTLDGDMVVEFSQKAKSHIINAGVYVMKPSIFILYDVNTKSLEKDLLPKLAKINSLQGFFTHGKYFHLPELL
ncbi:MAG: sugar phosphate nucleotidyltransferase [Candidatus Woesearchaeota archaeon]